MSEGAAHRGDLGSQIPLQGTPGAGKLHLKELNGREFRELLTAGQPMVVQFGSPTCEPCHALEPTMARLAANYQGRVHVVRVDVDKQADLGRRYNIWALPTVILFHHGEHRKIGARDSSGLDAAMRKLLADASAAGPKGHATTYIRPERDGAGLLPVSRLHPSLTPLGRDIENVGIPACLSEDGFSLDGLIYRVGTSDAAGIRVGCGQVLTNRHVFEQLGGERQGGAFLGRKVFPRRPELTGRAAPPALPGGSLVMPWYVGRYSDWALLDEAESSVCAMPRFRSAKSLRRDETLWIVGGSDGECDFVTVGHFKYVKGANGMLRDCDAQPGMSGSPVIDAEGNVVGVFSTKFGWPGRRAMFVTIDSIAEDIEALRSRDASLPQIRTEDPRR
jgi:thioredoxin 1